MTFALATGTIFVSRSVILVLLATGITGFLLTAIQVLPYSLLSQYHKDTLVRKKYSKVGCFMGMTKKFVMKIHSSIDLSELNNISKIQTGMFLEKKLSLQNIAKIKLKLAYFRKFFGHNFFCSEYFFTNFHKSAK